ncbi:unnamed protein product [Calicophoron daubneyi]|uniref:Uncharacterized protein n=1 Tax=Calicophoron daubneyi TaxID=300641 RepID=A0AAV2TQJ1_CALDB
MAKSTSSGKKNTSVAVYPLSMRWMHWILARMGLFQTIFLFMWLGERAGRDSAPPIKPWIIYVHAGIGLIASTCLSARFLSRISLYTLVGMQLHVAYLYLFETKLAYSHWLRTRLAIRSIASGSVYLRMLGVQMRSSGSNGVMQSMAPSSSFTFGLALLSVFAMLSSLLSLPFTWCPIDREAQLMEEDSTWSVLAGVNPAVGPLLSATFFVASIFYSIPLLGAGGSIVPRKTNSLFVRLVPMADKLVLTAMICLGLLRDANISYWVSAGSGFWLQCRLLLDNFIVILGILVTGDLCSATEKGCEKQKHRKSK